MKHLIQIGIVLICHCYAHFLEDFKSSLDYLCCLLQYNAMQLVTTLYGLRNNDRGKVYAFPAQTKFFPDILSMQLVESRDVEHLDLEG